MQKCIACINRTAPLGLLPAGYNGGVVSPDGMHRIVGPVAAASPWRYYILWRPPEINMAFRRGPPRVSKAPTIPLFSAAAAAGVRLFVYMCAYT